MQNALSEAMHRRYGQEQTGRSVAAIASIGGTVLDGALGKLQGKAPFGRTGKL